MKWFLYIVLLMFALYAPVERLDVARLEPVEAVAVTRENGEVVMKTDTGDVGRGASVAEALADMKRNAPSVIYLDTAECLLVAENAGEDVESLGQILKPSVLVGNYAGGDVGDAAAYIRVHGNGLKLHEWLMREN